MGCHFLLQGILPDPGIEPGSLALQADSLPAEPPRKPKLLPAAERLSLQATTPELACHNQRVPTLQKKDLHDTMKNPHGTTMTRSNRIKKTKVRASPWLSALGKWDALIGRWMPLLVHWQMEEALCVFSHPPSTHVWPMVPTQ